MISKETLHNQIYECDSSEAIILPKGEVGKTKGFLVGCIVPIVQYKEQIILGHFGPRETEKADRRIGNLLHPVVPDQVFIYHNSMTDDSFRAYRAKEYLSLFEKMVTLMANLTHVSASHIKRLSYPTFSDVHVDWSRSNNPKIYSLPSAYTYS